MKALSIWCLLLLLHCSHGGRDNQGTEFILTFLANYKTSTGIELFMTTTSNIAAIVNVTLPLYDPTYLQMAIVERKQIVKVIVPAGIRGVGTALENKGVWIQSDRKISVFGVNKEAYSTDAYLALPVDVLSTEYYAMTYVGQPELGMVATQDNTTVKVTLPNIPTGSLHVTYNGLTYTNGDTFSFTFNRFQTVQLYDAQWTSDFTGAHVTSDKPIGLVGGNMLAIVPYAGGGTADHLTEQIPPVDTLGKQFYTYSTPERLLGDIIRILAVEDDTQVNLSSANSFTLNTAEYRDLDLDTNNYIAIESNKGILVALFSKSYRRNTIDSPNGGDPAMTFLLPRPQWAADYTYSTVRTPTNTEFINQLVIHIDPNEVDGLRLDQNNITAVTWNNITGVSDIVIGIVNVSDGSHNIYHIDPAVVFSAISTGIASFNSYAFAAGTRMALINTPCVNSTTVAGDTVDNDCDERIDEEINNGIDDDGDGLIDEDLAVPPRVEGNWGSWTAWSNCSETCEAIGNQTRTRNCDNPAPANGGQSCSGNSSELISCDVTHLQCIDGEWGSWTAWSNCSETCEAIGNQTRTRNCDNPAPANGGQSCSGNSSELISCNVTHIDCPVVDGNWGPWTAWSNCSETCEAIGNQTRTRNCDNPAPAHGGQSCSGNSSELIPCNVTHIDCPVDGNWGSWTAWSNCSETCEAIGNQTRTRNCDNPAPAHGGQLCSGNSSELISCNVTHIDCPVDGNWGCWTAWSNCSETCEAIGNQTRTRNCDSPAPANGGQSCSGNSSELIPCNVTHIDCPVDGNWESWTAWSNCSETCEAIGNQTRTRNCDNPAPAHGGQSCSGNSSELISCNVTLIDCPVDGNWTTWSAWDNCTGTCDTGTQYRDRNCTNPTPKGGGNFCLGSANETISCILATACPPTSSSNNVPLIAGLAVGGVVALVAVATGCCLLHPSARKRRVDNEEEEKDLPGSDTA